MAILRSLDGKFYEIPDDQVNNFLIPEDKVKEKLQACGMAEPGPEAGPPTAEAPTPTVLVQIYGSAGMAGAGAPQGAPPPQAAATGGEVQPYSHYWRNYWRNYWHNYWRNNWYNYWQNWYGG